MDEKTKVLKFIDKNLFITMAEAKKEGISPMTLSRMAAGERLYSTERGVYTSTLEWLTDPLKKYLPACTLYMDAIVSGISSLTYYDLTDAEERNIWISIPTHRVVKNPKYRTVRSQGLWHSLGVQTFKFGKRSVRIYDIEKTVIDAYKYQTEEVAYKALKAYLKRKERNLSKLHDYAKKLGKSLEDQIRFFLADE